MDNIDHETDFRNVPQNRRRGSGEGRTCRPWASRWGWLLIAAERICVKQAGSETALLKDRQWVEKWGIDKHWLGRELDCLFPGIVSFLLGTPGGPDPLRDLLNRVYKMYYSGTSDRGPNHDPKTRASVSGEHWRRKSYRKDWEKKIIYIVQKGLVCRVWRDWI